MTIQEFERSNPGVHVIATRNLPSILPEWPLKLTNDPDLGDNVSEDQREPHSRPPLKSSVPTEEQMITAALDFFKSASRQDMANALGKIDSETLDAIFRAVVEARAPVPLGLMGHGRPSHTPAALPADAPPLWAERTTGREVSPVGWIRLHYGNKSPDPDNWDPLGLTREMLAEIDPHLARAYAKMISRDRECALPGLPPKDVVHIADPVLALARKKQQVQEASARYRKRRSSRHIA